LAESVIGLLFESGLRAQRSGRKGLEEQWEEGLPLAAGLTALVAFFPAAFFPLACAGGDERGRDAEQGGKGLRLGAASPHWSIFFPLAFYFSFGPCRKGEQQGFSFAKGEQQVETGRARGRPCLWLLGLTTLVDLLSPLFGFLTAFFYFFFFLLVVASTLLSWPLGTEGFPLALGSRPLN
jgi:hypothetical protein